MGRPDISARHPGIQAVMRHFEYSHLPDPLMQVSRYYADLAWMTLAMILTDDPQLTQCLHRLLEAKDCAVRAYRIDLETRHTPAPPPPTGAEGQPLGVDKLTGPIGTRWRGIDSHGNVAAEPTPEPPDDPDEGETGPPQTEA